MKNIIPIVFLLLAACAYGQNIQKFPYAASIKDMELNTFQTTQIENNGDPIIVDFWATWCKPCIVKYNTLSEKYAEWQEEFRVKIIAVSIDDMRNYDRVIQMTEKFD